MIRFKVGIPARYQSQRLPGKPLAMIGSKPMIQHVHDAAVRSGAVNVFVATDDQRIADCAAGFGATVCMTSDQHQSGSERLAEAVSKLGLADDEILVNVQGDEPFIAPQNIVQVAHCLADDPESAMSTLCAPLTSAAERENPNIVKLVRDRHGRALYFSRSVIPHERRRELATDVQFWQRHIGIYAYRVGFLKEYLALSSCEIEHVESLEQLRVLWHGYRIQVGQAACPSAPGIDTAEDLERARNEMPVSA